ncbi:MAG: hypothetical protein PHP98_08635 [Kiritimatiellae bacterium]|jgi:hypothetical protein|nr:hypothetical protein [Kiritimatiellia bacterium]
MSKTVMKSKKIMLGKDDVGMKHMHGAFRSKNLRRFRRIRIPAPQSGVLREHQGFGGRVACL